MTHVHIDFETRSALDLKKVGAYVYAEHPTTTAWCMAWAIDDGPVELWKLGDPAPMDLFRAIAHGATVVGHNVYFEINIWNGPMHRDYSWPMLDIAQCECTMSMAYAMALPGSLEKASLAVGIDQKKDMAGNRIMIQLAQPRQVYDDGTIVWWDDPEKFARLYAYCIQDIHVERELHKRLMRLSPQEVKTWHLDHLINNRGIQVDIKAATTAIEVVKYEKERLDKEMKRITKNAVSTCTATGQLADWIRWQGVEVESVAKADVTELLNRPSLPGLVRDALLLRQEAAKSSTAKLQAMVDRTNSDGRIRGIFQYHGAGTGRWAGRGIQPQNFPRPKIGQNEIETIFDVLEKVKP